MRTTRRLIALMLTTGALLIFLAPHAKAEDPKHPGPYEVILHGDNFFGTGLSKRYHIEKTVSQRLVYLYGQLLDKNFRSVQVGSKVIASLYRARPGNSIAGFEGTQLLHSATSIQPIYSILVINRKSDGRAEDDYRRLPFRVEVRAHWSSWGVGHGLYDEYFLADTPQHSNIRDLSSGLLPSDQGADSIIIWTGRYPTDVIKVTLFDQPRCQGTNARTFPPQPSKNAVYGLHDYGFGDKARSLRITWEGPAFGSTPGVSGAVFSNQPDVKGNWQNQLGQRYVFGTNGSRFAWKFPTLHETGEGRFLDATHIEARWTAADGSKHGPIRATVDNDGQGHATKIRFDNGVVLTPVGVGPKPPAVLLDLTGAWTSNFGKVDLKHQGPTVTGMVHYPNGAMGTIKGTLQGTTVTFTWFVSAQFHGHGTLTLSTNSKHLDGPVVDEVSKVQVQWKLTR